ncbi:glycosyltransferase family 4 protein [Carboxydocella sp. ULO1]|uniref:glycosyltransferase family 4 protein n=1 Tax=Carboxydocella sp. ULO1 TaxID=1926599 RepID=UPI0009ADC29E|nr:glycosyltransferase family 4 protein [Carboxydocella sp. ULO1]GAW30125.1 glycosyl transferase [Carboxydocella sp. ULO1]
MRIAQIHWAFPPIIGGVESHLAMLGPALVEKGCQVSLLTGAVPGEPEMAEYEGMKVKRTPLLDLNSLNPEIIAARAEEIRTEFKNFIEQFKPDLLHVHNMHYFSPVHADILFELKKEYGIPLILTSHNVWADSDPTWQEMNKRAQAWDAIIAVSHYIKREMIRVGYEEKKITVIHHGIDLNRFVPPGSKDLAEIERIYPQFKGRRVIFHPARMSLDKGCHISVQALAEIRREFPGVLLVLAGTSKTVDWGSHQQKHVRQIMDLIEELQLQDHVFVKLFAWSEMPVVYQAAEFCIYPSCFEEPFGLVMLESMASERPIIVSRAGGMPEIVRDSINGYIVPMGDARALAERCCRLLADPIACRQMGKTGRRMVEKFWTREVMTEATLAVYKKVSRGKGVDYEQLQPYQAG